MDMKNWIIQTKWYFIGAISGALAGFLYWKYIGCLGDSCAITSSPLNSTLYFALMGALVFGSFQNKKEKEGKKNSKTEEQ